MSTLLIKNAKLVNDSAVDVLIENNKIVKVAEVINEPSEKILDLEKKAYISAGWIDDHVHCYEKMTLYYDFPDEIGVKKGVTTVIDAGSTGAENIGDFYELSKKAITNVYALVNISEWGILAQDELSDLKKIKRKLIQKVVNEFPDFIVGLKARMSKTVIGTNGIRPLELAKKIQKETNNLPLMVHIGSTPPDLAEIVAKLDAGDVVTHCFNGKANGILDEKGQVHSFVLAAYERGIIFDIGHGTDSFNFNTAEKAFNAGIKAQSISTDIYHRNRESGPVHDLATTMEKCLLMGYSLEEIIDKVTIQPAKNFHLKNKGHLAVGYDADLTIFRIGHRSKELIDSNGNQKVATTQICPLYTVIEGVVYPNELL